jgi:hypothetical protein
MAGRNAAIRLGSILLPFLAVLLLFAPGAALLMVLALLTIWRSLP